MKITITNNKNIDPQKLINLWVSVGWGREDDYNINDVETAIKNTSTIIQAVNENNELLGVARVLSDKIYHTVIAEIIVHPNHQKSGIGTKMMDKIKKDYKHTAIYLDALGENEQFFQNQGFIKRDKMLVYSIGAKK